MATIPAFLQEHGMVDESLLQTIFDCSATATTSGGDESAALDRLLHSPLSLLAIVLVDYCHEAGVALESAPQDLVIQACDRLLEQLKKQPNLRKFCRDKRCGGLTHTKAQTRLHAEMTKAVPWAVFSAQIKIGSVSSLEELQAMLNRCLPSRFGTSCGETTAADGCSSTTALDVGMNATAAAAAANVNSLQLLMQTAANQHQVANLKTMYELSEGRLPRRMCTAIAEKYLPKRDCAKLFSANARNDTEVVDLVKFLWNYLIQSSATASRQRKFDTVVKNLNQLLGVWDIGNVSITDRKRRFVCNLWAIEVAAAFCYVAACG
jgi:hypothetical protein